jgi:hypothetical protein
MAPEDTGIDFFGLHDSEADGGAVATAAPEGPPDRRPAPHIETAPSKAAEEDVADFLLGAIEEGQSGDDADTESETSKRVKGPKSKVESQDLRPPDLGPATHSEGTEGKRDTDSAQNAKLKVSSLPADLLIVASEWGISPDEAAEYPSAEALAATIRMRQFRHQQSLIHQEAQNAAAKGAKEPKDDFKLPELDLDKIDFEDPDQAKAAFAKLFEAAKALNEKRLADKKATEEKLTQFQSEQEQAAERANRAANAKIAQAFDEEVPTWGDDFAELLGVPSKGLTSNGYVPGERGTNLKRLNDYVTRQQRGHVALYGVPAEEEAVALTRQFVREARYALWPDKAASEAKRSLSKKLKQQKGGVAIRLSGKTDGAPEQGDRAAMLSVKDFMAQQGLDPWSRKTG